MFHRLKLELVLVDIELFVHNVVQSGNFLKLPSVKEKLLFLNLKLGLCFVMLFNYIILGSCGPLKITLESTRAKDFPAHWVNVNFFFAIAAQAYMRTCQDRHFAFSGFVTDLHNSKCSRTLSSPSQSFFVARHRANLLFVLWYFVKSYLEFLLLNENRWRLQIKLFAFLIRQQITRGRDEDSQ